jgi:hypothetical protein
LIIEGDQSVGMEFVVIFQQDDPDKPLADDAKEKYLDRADRLMKISLATLATEGEAVQLYKSYAKMHPVKTSSGKPAAPSDDADHGRIIGEPK